MKRRPTQYSASRGMTLVEVVIAVALSSLIVIAMFQGISAATRMVRAGTSQTRFTLMGRQAAQEITERVERARYVQLNAETNGVRLIAPDKTTAEIYFDDADTNLLTLTNNRLVYDPDVSLDGEIEVLCTHVCPIAGEQMFSLSSASLGGAAQFSFHIGDSTNVADAAFSGTGHGYQGLEVRMSAAARNLMRWHD